MISSPCGPTSSRAGREGIGYLRVWLITVGEPLPVHGADDRPWRTGILASLLARRGHEVLWWTSNVDHFRKRYYSENEARFEGPCGEQIQLLAGRLYHRNVSMDRLVNHAQNAARFRALAPQLPRPDIILCSFPTIELSDAATQFARARKIPAILDVRDLWPDIFLDVLPRWTRPLGRLLLRPYFVKARRALASCEALFAVSEDYLTWSLEKAGRARSPDDAVFALGYPEVHSTQQDDAALDERLRSLGVGSGARLLTFVGTFGRTYDLKTVLEAARALQQRDSADHAFVFCGAGERESEWRRLAEGVRSVAFTGWLSSGELACLLARSAIGLAAYAQGAPQGIPNKLIEYLSAGLPVLCSLEGEARRLIEESGCGVHYAAGDSASLLRALARVANEETRAAMAHAAKNLFAARFLGAAVYGRAADHLEHLARSLRRHS